MKSPTFRLWLLAIAVGITGCYTRVVPGGGGGEAVPEMAPAAVDGGDDPEPEALPPAGGGDPDAEQRDDQPDPEPQPPTLAVEIDSKAHRVVRKEASGQVGWATPLTGYVGGVRPPDLLLDAERVYVTHGDGVTALDAQTGKVIWHSLGPNNGMCLSGDLLLATNSGEVMARTAATGVPVFRIALRVDERFDPAPVEKMAGGFVVQAGEGADGQGIGFLIDRTGRVRHRFDHQVIAGRLLGKGRVFLTSHEMVCRARGDKVVWVLPFRRPEWVAGGGLVSLEGGDLLAYLYGQINDSGVQLLRLDPRGGKQVWQTQCAGLGVSHSKYHHWANARVDGDRIKVTSRASFGTFVEYLDLASGRRIKRLRPEEPRR
jgi:outer membrane protein assembly factor BamB